MHVAQQSGFNGHPAIHQVLTMALSGLGMETLFYLYPIGVVVILYTSQLLAYLPRYVDTAGAIQQRNAIKVVRVYATGSWILQLLLVVLLVCISPKRTILAKRN
jgi:hypothetical protein